MSNLKGTRTDPTSMNGSHWLNSRRCLIATLVVPVPMLAISAATAQSDKGIARCAAITNSIERLACYDALAKVRKLDAPAKKTSTVSKWQIQVSTSKIDDSKSVYLTVESENPIAGRYSFQGAKRANLVARCQERKTGLYFVSNLFLTTGSFQVTYRLDRQSARSVWLQTSTDYKAFGWWSGGQAIAMLRRMMKAKRIILRFTPHGDNPRTVEFDISGLAEAIKPLRAACRW